VPQFLAHEGPKISGPYSEHVATGHTIMQVLATMNRLSPRSLT